MKERENELGALQITYGTSPAYLQRAAIVAVFSFVFFLAMLAAFSLTQKFGYFLIGTAFLVVEILTLLGWQSLRRNGFKIYENGFAYKNQDYLWNEIESASVNQNGKQKAEYEIETRDGKIIALSDTIDKVEEIIKKINDAITRRK